MNREEALHIVKQQMHEKTLYTHNWCNGDGN